MALAGISLVYFNKVLEILEQSPAINRTVLGIVKQLGYTSLGLIFGGTVAGPSGALIGSAFEFSIFGGWLGYTNSDDYSSLLTVLRNLDEDEMYRLQMKIQELVGSVTIEEFVKWIQNEANRKLLITVIGDAAKAA